MSMKQINMNTVNLHFPSFLLEDNGSFGSDFELGPDLFEGCSESEEPREPQERVFALVLGIILTKTRARLKETAWPKQAEYTVMVNMNQK